MTDLLESCDDLPRRHADVDDVVVEQGQRLPSLLILVEGDLAVERDGVVLARLDRPGTIVGEMSTLLDSPATATVRARTASTLLVADDAASFLVERPDVLLQVARALARRLDNLTGHLVDVKKQYGDESGHLGMLDDVLTTLMHDETPRVQPGSARMPDLDY
jgi:CRP-like cAMP-binding protein